MTRLIEFLIALALVLVLFLVIGVLLPSHRVLEGSVESNRKMTIVYDTVNNVHRLKDWSLMLPSDPTHLQYSGGEVGNVGKGAKVDFTSEFSKAWRQGNWEIIDSQAPEGIGGSAKVIFAIVDGTPGTNKKTEITLTPSGNNNRNVRITQKYMVDYGWNLYGRFLGMYLGSQVGDSMNGGLKKLSSNLASIPNFDYRVEGSKLTDLKISDVPAENLLVVNAGSIERNNAAIKKSMLSNQEWIKRVMDSNGLEAAGPIRIVTTELATQTYTFDVVQPVRKKAASSKDKDAKKVDDSEQANAAEVAAPEVTEVAELEVKVAGTPVTYVHTEPHQAATAKYTGYMSELEAARNAMRAWTMANGHAVTNRPYDDWNNGVDKSFDDEQSTYNLYWEVRY